MSIDTWLVCAGCVGAVVASHRLLVFNRPKRLPTTVQRGEPAALNTPRPSNPCTKCSGTGKVKCGNCNGVGRVNYPDKALLPKGVAPQWCSYCRASGKWYCERCMGTGARRDPIGFRLG